MGCAAVMFDLQCSAVAARRRGYGGMTTAIVIIRVVLPKLHLVYGCKFGVILKMYFHTGGVVVIVSGCFSGDT